MKVKVLVAQSCPVLWDPMNCSLPGFFCSWNSPGKNAGGVAITFSSFLTQGLNLGLLHCRLILHCRLSLRAIRVTREYPKRCAVGRINASQKNPFTVVSCLTHWKLLYFHFPNLI